MLIKLSIFCLILSNLIMSSFGDHYIHGGILAKPGQFPFQVSLRRRENLSKSFCAGAILNKRWIVTAKL